MNSSNHLSPQPQQPPKPSLCDGKGVRIAGQLGSSSLSNPCDSKEISQLFVRALEDLVVNQRAALPAAEEDAFEEFQGVEQKEPGVFARLRQRLSSM